MAVIKYKDANGNYVALTNYTVQPITPVQSTGSSTTEVMSQNAVTTALALKANSDDVYTKTVANSTFLGKTAKAADSTKADSATKATQDASGNVITSTYATKSELTAASTAANTYTDEKVAALVNGAPETLDTLDEIAAALNDNADILDVLNASIGNKLDTTTAASTYAAKATTLSGYGITDAKIASGVITLGSSTITPLTEHPDTSTLTSSTAIGPTANVTGSNGSTIVVPQITVDANGHITAVTNRTYTSKDTTYSAATTSANGLMSSSDKTWTTFMQKVNTVTSIASVPVNGHLCVATISANGSFTMASTPTAGREVHIIVKNSSTSDITITMPTTSAYVNVSGETSLTVAGSGYGEINVVSDGSLMYVRAI